MQEAKKIMAELMVGESPPMLADLPSELLAKILSHLDARSILHLRTTSRRLRAQCSDPFNWAALSWKVTNNHVRDVDGLLLGLSLSRGVLRDLTVYGRRQLRLPQFLEQVVACANLQSVSLIDVAEGFTDGQVLRLLDLPALRHLSLNMSTQLPLTVAITQRQHCQLQSLTFNPEGNIRAHVSAWSAGGYTPPILRVV